MQTISNQLPQHLIQNPSRQRSMRQLLSCALAAAVIFTPCAAVAEDTAQAALPWIDVHVHPFSNHGSYNFGDAVNQAVAKMTQTGMGKIILMAPPMAGDAKSNFDYKDFAGMVKKLGTRAAFLGGGGSLNMMIQRAADGASDSDKHKLEEEANAILQAGAVGFGEIAAHHLSLVPSHPYESVPADSPLLLQLADIAARNDVPIDLHFDPVEVEQSAPEWAVPPNPRMFQPNVAAFERLLDHNRDAKIVWAHAGSDQLGQWTLELSRRLLQAHPNLYMSLRLSAPGRAPQNNPLAPPGVLKPGWLKLLTDFPDRFVLGSDTFFASAGTSRGAGGEFASRQAAAGDKGTVRTNRLLAALPPEVARKIAFENAMRIYKLKE